MEQTKKEPEERVKELCTLLRLPQEEYDKNTVDGAAPVSFVADDFKPDEHQSALIVIPALMAMLKGRTIRDVVASAHNGQHIHFAIETDRGDYFALELRSICPESRPDLREVLEVFDKSLIRPLEGL